MVHGIMSSRGKVGWRKKETRKVRRRNERTRMPTGFVIRWFIELAFEPNHCVVGWEGKVSHKKEKSLSSLLACRRPLLLISSLLAKKLWRLFPVRRKLNNRWLCGKTKKLLFLLVRRTVKIQIDILSTMLLFISRCVVLMLEDVFAVVNVSTKLGQVKACELWQTKRKTSFKVKLGKRGSLKAFIAL